ncbi:MAG: chromosomal replication initiator protein DnaA, partial [Epsilonproteobacteria bacterium]|nr:chromosomal replication initiator protein DnaA [Campylobacterota bacterium]
MNIGQKVINSIKEEIKISEFERYFKNLIFDEDNSKSDLVIFYAPNIYSAKWIQRKYKDLIASKFEIYTNIRPSIKIEIKKSPKENTPIKEQKRPNYSIGTSTPLNPSYTFDSFIVGSSNQFAYSASISVAQLPGKQYNPLFIYGGVGLGKTHLLQAIGNYRLNEGDRVIYATFEQFMNKYISHVRSQTMDRFREYYRNCDLLLIDDIQFISQKEQTQEEFFHTFNELHSQGKQIVLTSDRHPNKIAGLVDRLKSRFEWGLLADIQPPGLETKIAIIEKKCELNGIRLDKEIIHYLATNMGDNIREIEGTIIKLNALSSMLNQPITLEFAKNALKDQIREKQSNISLEDIINIVCKELNIKPSEVKSKNRSKNVVNARRIIIYLARNLTLNSMPQIATQLGLKDHTAISHAMKKTQEIIQKDENFKLLIEEL